MKYVVIYHEGGLWEYHAMHDESLDALRDMRYQMSLYPARQYEMHPVHESIADLLTRLLERAFPDEG